ncbi:MAG: copper-binding protein [Proteobacteria bacterium]|nr:copper-binding protein [Pseudomonadota bacterium]
MFKRLAPALVLLAVASIAHAQIGGGSGGGRGRGGGRGGGGPGPAPAGGSPRKAPAPFNQLQFVGVVKAIDTETGRVTIAYEPVEAINWPAGTQPFPVAKTAMLSSVTVGQKVRFDLDSGAISALAPFDPPPAAPR